MWTQLNNYQLNIDIGGRLRLAFQNTDIHSENDVIQSDTWQHLVFARNGTTVKGYVNTVEVIDYSISADHIFSRL